MAPEMPCTGRFGGQMAQPTTEPMNAQIWPLSGHFGGIPVFGGLRLISYRNSGLAFVYFLPPKSNNWPPTSSANPLAKFFTKFLEAPLITPHLLRSIGRRWGFPPTPSSATYLPITPTDVCGSTTEATATL